LLTGLGMIGAAVERMFAALRSTPRQVARAMTQKRPRRFATVAALAVLLLYLLAIGDIAVSASGESGFGPPVQFAFDNVFRAKAAYLFEPVIAIRANGHITLFLSPVNLALGAAVAGLAAANVALTMQERQPEACRRSAIGPLVGVLPTLGLGFACCAPTLLVALGAGMGAALLPVALMVRPVLYPLTIGLLIVALVWRSYRVRDSPAGEVGVPTPAVVL
ncbi:MAG: hypothetical protein K0U70_14410, partial [Actinomycetia bacterium]|nr:hypothetical protein [Actinomycetes bacterium]